MNKTKRALSLIASAAIMASAFHAFAISASANVTKYSNDWEAAEATGFSDAGRSDSSLVTDFEGNMGTCVEMHNSGGAKGTQKMEIGTVSANKVYIEFDIYFTNEAGSKYVAVGSGLGRMGTDSFNDIAEETGIALALQNYTGGTVYINETNTGIATQQWLKVSAVADFSTKKVAVTITPKVGAPYSSTVAFMDSTIENINSITLNRFTNPTTPALYLDNLSVSVPELEYSDGSVRANIAGTVIVASYSGDHMTGAKTYDVAADSVTAIDAADGDKIMFWDGMTNALPLIDAITVGEEATEEPTPTPTAIPTPTPTAVPTPTPTAVPTPTPTAEPTSTPTAVPDRVYIDESFDSYEAGDVIASAKGEGNSAPEAVTYGNITYKAGYRKDGINDKISFTSDGSLSVLGTKFGGSGRGVLFTFETADIPAVSELADGQVLAMSFDMATSSKFTVTGYGEIAEGALGSTSPVNVSLILDKSANKQYMQVTDSNGNILVSNEADLIAETFSGMDFRDSSGTSTANAYFTIDNIKVETKAKAKDNDQIPNELIISGGQSFIAAPKTADTNSTEAFTVTVNDDAGAVIAPHKYSLEWAVYPAGTTTPDGNVTISEDGIVSVSKNFMASGSVAAYDVVAKIEMKDAGQRGLNAAKTIYIGKNDVIYYEPIAWAEAAGSRNSTKDLAKAVTLPELSSITLNLSMQEPEGQRTLFLVTNTGSFVGLQYQKADGRIVVGTGWSGNSNMNQNGDIDKFTNQETLITGYKSNSPIAVTFTIDKATNTVTVSSGTANVSLPFAANSPATFTGFKTGLYRSYGAMTMADVTVTEPDPDYLSIVGDEDFAKAYGTTVTRDYALNQSIIVSGETFSWTVSPANQGVTADNGKLSVADSAPAGIYTLTATSDSRATKTASLEIEVGGFRTISQENATIEGANTYGGVGQTGTYRITKLIDSYGDDVTDILPAAVWTSNNTSVVTITPDGALTVTGKGTTTLTATITNGNAVSTFTVPVTVDIYFITANATGNSTTIDTSALITPATDSTITGYQVTTSKNGKLVKQTVVTTAPTTVDTTGADKLEIAPIFTVTNVTGSSSKTVSVPEDTYNVNITGASGTHFDPYVNDQMLANNMLQGGTAVNYISVNDIVVKEGYATLNLRDYSSNSKAGKITIVKSPSIVDRIRKVYVLGDSLVCNYANGGDASHNYQTGWGQVLGSYLKDVEVVDLGNSGTYAEILYVTAFSQVLASAEEGDIMILESGYNDRSYSTKSATYDAVKAMYDEATAKGVVVILATPPASAHDYKAGISWSDVIVSVANDTGAKLLKHSELTYSFFESVYGNNVDAVKATYNVSDGLHSNYNGAHKLASIAAGALIGLGYGDIVNTSYKYTFKDSLGNTITCQAAASN